MQQQEMTKKEIRTMYSEKKAAVRIHYTHHHERSSRGLTKKETNEEKLQKKKKKKISLIHVFSFSTIFVAIFTNCFIVFSNVSGNVFANHALFLPYRNRK